MHQDLSDQLASHILKLLFISVVITCLTMPYSRKCIVHDSAWKSRIEVGESDYHVAREWGFPLGFLRDNPYKGTKDRLDKADGVDAFAFLFDCFAWFCLVAVLYPILLLKKKKGQEF